MAAKKRGTTRKRKPAAKRATAKAASKTKSKRAPAARKTRGAAKKSARRAPAQRRPAARRAPARVIAVVGATGAQGGGLVRAILSDPKVYGRETPAL